MVTRDPDLAQLNPGWCPCQPCHLSTTIRIDSIPLLRTTATVAIHLMGSTRPGQTGTMPRDRIAEALYHWCCENHAIGHVFNQNELLSSEVIPNKDLTILVSSVQYLVGKNLFRTHDFKATGSIGWELVSQERAEK